MLRKLRKRRGEYFCSLFNESRPEGSEVGSSSPLLPQDCYYSRINQREVQIALQKMGRNKVVGPDQIPIEAWKCLKDEGVKWLTCLFNKIFSSANMPDEWRLSEVIPIYKNKGDVSTTEAICLLRSLMEKYRERQRDLHMAFLDMEKAYDCIPRELVWRTLIDKGAPRRYLRVLRDMYEGAKTRVRTSVGDTEFFPVEAEGLNSRLEKLSKALEDKGLRISRDKTEYLRCDFGRCEEMDDPDINMEEYIQREAEKARRRGQDFNWETATYGKVRYVEDINYFKDFKNEFPDIIYNDALTSEPEISSEPTISTHHVKKVDFDFEISFGESDDEDYTFTYDKNSFSYKLIDVNDLKLDSVIDDDKIDIKQSSEGISIEPSHNVISIDVVDTAYPNPMDMAY
ncbi:hypothetical protein Tco_1063754 [Tanacetum coccineum]